MFYYLGLGSNLGDREQTISRALILMDERVGRRIDVAPLIYTPAQGFTSEHVFCNTVALYESALQPHEVLAMTQTIEQELGRTEHSILLNDGTKIYADRQIDIDLIQVYDNEGQELHMNTPTLTLPHPRMNERTFVLQPIQYLREHADIYNPQKHPAYG